MDERAVFINKLVEKLGEVNFPRLGKIINKYKFNFLYECLDKFPKEKAEELDPNSKVGYFQRICQTHYKEKDLRTINKLDLNL